MKKWMLLALFMGPVTVVQAQTVIVHAMVMPPFSVYSNMKFGVAAQLSTNLVSGVAGYPYAGAANEGGYGLMRTRAWADSTASNAPEWVNIYNLSEWVDTLTIIPSPELHGAAATLEVTFALSGTGFAEVSESYSCSSGFSLEMAVGDNTIGPYTGTWQGDGNYVGVPLVGMTNVVVPITLGSPFNLFSRLITSLNYNRSATAGYARASADFSRSAQWFTIGEITGDFGVLTNFTIESASGHDWLSMPVQPLPLLENGGATTNGQMLILNGLSIAFTNILEGAASMDSTNWSSLAEYVDASGQTNCTVNLESNNVQFFRIRQE